MAKTLVVVVAVAAVAAVALWFADGDESLHSTPVSSAADASAPLGSRPAAAPRAAAAIEPTAAVALVPSARDAVAGRVVLRGRFDGLASGEAGPGEVIVYVLREGAETLPAPLRVATRPNGTFECDVSEAMAVTPPVEAFGVSLDDPAWLRTWVRVDVPRHPETDASGAAVLTAVLPVRPAATVEVRVADAEGRPVPGARVAPFPWDGGGPDEFPTDVQTSDATGVARVRIDAGRESLCVAQATDLAPAAVRLTAKQGRADVTLARGEALDVVVREGGRAVAGAEVWMFADDVEGRWLHFDDGFGDDAVFWQGGALAATGVMATTDAAGRCRVPGLADRRYRAVLATLGPGRRIVAEDVRVERPHDGAAFDIETARVRIEVRDGGPGGAGVAAVRLQCFRGRTVPVTDAEGCADLEIAAGLQCQIQTDKAGWRAAVARFTAPAAGVRETVVIAVARVPRGRVVLTVREPGGHPVTPAGVGLQRLDPGDAPADAAPGDDFRLLDEDPDGEFEIDGLAPGRWRIVVRPDRNWNPDFTWDRPGATWLDETLEVDVPADGSAEAAVTVRPGGRLRIAARDARGGFLSAACRITDASGRTPDVQIATRYGSGAHSVGSGALGWNAASEVVPALAPGRYRVDLACAGFAELSREVTVEAGRTTDLDVALEPRGDGAAPPRPVLVPAEER